MEAEAPVATSARNRQAATRELKVATWNIHGAVGADRRYAPARIVGGLDAHLRDALVDRTRRDA